MQLAYLVSLVLSLTALSLIDWRYKLVVFYDARRAAKTLSLAVMVFAVWDVLGIALGIFFSGHSGYALDWFLLPNFPIEEVCFLMLLSYVSLLGQRFLERRA